MRAASVPEIVASLPETIPAVANLAGPLPRTIVTTGIGTSEGHARHLAELCVRLFGWPARFASTGSLREGAPIHSREDWLVVFSQGLSANARYALSNVEDWGSVFLVTGLTPDTPADDGLTDEKRAWLMALEASDVMRLELGCGPEYGALLRVIGARAGYVVGWSLARTLAQRRLVDDGALAIDSESLRGAQVAASDTVAAAFPRADLVSSYFDPQKPLMIVTDGGHAEYIDQLTLKLAEGMLRPRPRIYDVLEFAHGPLQGVSATEASVLYLENGADAESGRWRERLAATLHPDKHDLRVLRSTLDWPFAAVEFEACFDELVLRSLVEGDQDLTEWPGADREEALYGMGPVLPASNSERQALGHRPFSYELESAVWPEVESWIESGRRTALVGLGSIEQHGPHLPLGTDRWIADALVAGLAERLGDAVGLPAWPIGCASEHLDFAGTLHVEPDTLERMLSDLFASLLRHGFERAFVFTAHGGNVDALRAMHDRVVSRAQPLEVRIETDMRVGAMQSEVVAEAMLSPLSAGPHAGEYETSLVAFLRSGSIRTNALVPGRQVEPGVAQGLFYPSLRPHAESGVLGDPSLAQAGRGPRYLAAWIDLLEAAYLDGFPGTAAKNRK